MKIMTTVTQQTLCLLLALYIGFFLNIAIFVRRFYAFAKDFSSWMGGAMIAELMATILVTFLLLRLLSLFGRTVWRILASFIVVSSVAASYYMTFLNVIIGYGIIASVMTTDIDLSREAIGWHFIVWMLLVSLPPLALIWLNRCRFTLLNQLKDPRQSLKNGVLMLLVGLVVWAPLRYLSELQSSRERMSRVDLPSYGGVVASSYLPSNWLSALGLYAWAQVDESSDHRSLLNPATQYTYVAPQDNDDTLMVFIIGETTRWDHMGILGYHRDTTPKLAQEKNLAAVRGTSCDTATKLSLRCMFVREGGVENNPQRTLKELNIFAVLKQLGFHSSLYAMQSELWFYSNTLADNIAYREQIGAEPANRGKAVDDILLVPQLTRTLEQQPHQKQLIILHTKGSHFSYAQRYPRSFARWTPECVGVDANCSKQELINAYDNTVLYTDNFIHSVIDRVRQRKAIVFYAADHGESINDHERLHGTPRNMAPPEQFRVPLMVWASDSYLASPARAAGFARLQRAAQMGVAHRHEEIYDSVLGCLGYTSPDGGINQNNNWCRVTH